MAGYADHLPGTRFQRISAALLWYHASVRCRWWTPLLSSLLLSMSFAWLGAQGNCPEGGRPDCPRAVAFFTDFQHAFRNNDRKKVATLVEYPLRTSVRGKTVSIRSRAELLAHYDEIFDAEVRCAILNATPNSVWGNWRGFAIGVGEIWFDGIIPRNENVDSNAPDFWTKYPFRVKTVNNGIRASVCKASQ